MVTYRPGDTPPQLDGQIDILEHLADHEPPAIDTARLDEIRQNWIDGIADLNAVPDLLAIVDSQRDELARLADPSGGRS